MLEVGIEVLRKDFCLQIGYNRRAVKTYSSPCADVDVATEPEVSRGDPAQLSHEPETHKRKQDDEIIS